MPVWNKDDCIFCGVCEKACRTQAITIKDGEITLEPSKCNYCGRCVKSCPTEAWQGKSGFIVSFGGTFGNSIQKGTELLPIIEDEDTLFRVADAAIDFFAENAQPGERLAKTLDRVGWDKLKEKVEAAYHG